MDEAFVPFARLVGQLLAFRGEFVDGEAGVRTYITSCDIDSPLELDVRRGDDGRLEIGTTPPVYPLLTTTPPMYHQVRIAAALEDETDG